MKTESLFVHALKHRITSNLDLLKEYSHRVKFQLNEDVEELQNKYDEELAKELEEDEKHDIEMFYSDKLWKFSEQFKKISWNSLFVSHYSLLEFEIMAICKFLHKHRDYELKLSDLADTGIFQAKKYLAKVVKVDSLFLNQEWEKIIYYNKIRNNIVHETGNINGSKHEGKIKYFHEEQGNFTLTSIHDIILTYDFVIEANETIKTFLIEAFEVTINQ